MKYVHLLLQQSSKRVRTSETKYGIKTWFHNSSNKAY